MKPTMPPELLRTAQDLMKKKGLADVCTLLLHFARKGFDTEHVLPIECGDKHFDGYDRIDVDQQAFMHQLLTAIADGQDVRKPLGIPAVKIGHQQRDPSAQEIYTIVRLRMNADPGPTRGKKARACGIVGDVIGMDPPSVARLVNRYETEQKRLMESARKAARAVQRKLKASKSDKS